MSYYNGQEAFEEKQIKGKERAMQTNTIFSLQTICLPFSVILVE